MIRSGKYDQKMEEHVLASLLDKANEGVSLPDKKPQKYFSSFKRKFQQANNSQ